MSSGSAPGRATRMMTTAVSSRTVQRERVLGTVSRSAVKSPISFLSQSLNSGALELPETSDEALGGHVLGLLALRQPRDAALAVEDDEDQRRLAFEEPDVVLGRGLR